MYTTIDCKSFLLKELASRPIPWETSDKEWDKTSQYKEGGNIVREFQHKVEGLVLSVRENENGLSLDFDRSTDYLRNMKASGTLDIDPSEFFVAVAPVSSNHVAVYPIAKSFFYQENSIEDDGESMDMCAQSMFAIFPDLSIIRSTQALEITGAPAVEVWRRLLAVGFIENPTVNQVVGRRTVESGDCMDEDFNPMSALDEKINRLAGIQQANKPAPKVAPPPPAPVQLSAPGTPTAANGQVRTPPQRGGAGQTARTVAPPPLRRFGQTAVQVQHSSVQQDDGPSNIDMSMFERENWPPARKEDYPKAIEKLFAKKVLGAEDLKKLAQGLPKLENDMFLQITTLALAIQHPENPGVLFVVGEEKNRRKALGETVEYTPISTESFDIGFL